MRPERSDPGKIGIRRRGLLAHAGGRQTRPDRGELPPDIDQQEAYPDERGQDRQDQKRRCPRCDHGRRPALMEPVGLLAETL